MTYLYPHLINFRVIHLAYFLLLVCSTVYGLHQCNESQTTFTYTECDTSNHRWRIEVPKNPLQCEMKNNSSPVRGPDCDFSCESGQYLDLTIQACEECPVGTYSLGSGIRFDSWKTLPEGFRVVSESVGLSYSYHSKSNNCSVSKWKPNGHFIVSNEDDCMSSLSYSVKLQQPGTVTFSYLYPDENVMFHFYVENGQCETIHGTNNNVYLNITGADWKQWTANLNVGTNVLVWKTTGIIIGNNNKLSPVRIRDIEITGVTFTTECHQCQPGYVASQRGTHWCNPCPRNTFSSGGQSSCKPCNSQTHYAPAGSERCLERPPCKKEDYFRTLSTCDVNKMTEIKYEWVQPKVCLETLPHSVVLPKSEEKPCSPCNPGFSSHKKTCVPCPLKSYSNGTHECIKCPANTAPRYGLFYLWWDFLPKFMKTSCVSTSTTDCVQNEGWEAVGNAIQTIDANYGEVYLILVLALPSGFMRPIKPGIYGIITFRFELQCADNCRFYFIKDVPHEGTKVLKSWKGKLKKQTFMYIVTENKKRTSFTWTFEKKQPSDRASVFAINVTNVVDSSADSCIPCTFNVTGANCVPCPVGKYLNRDTLKCIPCTGNTRINADETGCEACGEGTTSVDDSTRCGSDCHFISNITGRHYDFTKLSEVKPSSNLPSFTSSGRRYNHVYNFSLCNNQGKGYAECIDNVTLARSGKVNSATITKITGMSCKSTSLELDGSFGQRVMVHSQPTLLSSFLENVTQEEMSQNTSEIMFPKDNSDDFPDVVYSMRAEQDGSGDCPDGRYTLLRLRCDPTVTEDSGKIEILGKCPDGTCNGCDFHFLWRSVHACPSCTDDDYLAVTGACIGGKIVTRYLWKSYPRKCIGGVDLPEERTVGCQDYSSYIRLAVAGGIVLLFIICGAGYRLWKKSKKLEYRYHRLVVDGKGGTNEGNLPEADTCALTDSESDHDDENDEVIFQKKKTRLFGKKKPVDYESVVLQPLSTKA